MPSTPTLGNLTYLGTMTGPLRSASLGSPALGNGLALRNTGSALKLYFCSSNLPNTPPVIECDVPGTYSGPLTGVHSIGSLPCQFKMAWGLRWDYVDQALYQTCHNNYDGDPATQPTLSRGRIVNGTLVSDGQWSFLARSDKMTDGGVTAVPSWFQTQYGVPRMAVGFGNYRSVVATGPASMGLALAAFDPPATGSTAAIPVRPLLSYPYSTHGPVNFPAAFQERMHRDTNYINNVGGDSAYPVNPIGTGYATWADWGYQCAVWIDTPSFTGLAAIVQRATGSVFYTNTVNAAGWRYDFVVYSAADLGAVAQGANPSSIQPTVDTPITWPGMPTNGPHADSPPHDITGVDFDPTTGIFVFGVRFGTGVDASTYRTTYPVFQLSGSVGPPPPPPPPPDLIVPTLTTVVPSTATRGTAVTVTLTGTNFVIPDTSISVSGDGVSVSNLIVNASTSITAVLTFLLSSTTGSRTVTVTTANGTSGTVAFTVTDPPPSQPPPAPDPPPPPPPLPQPDPPPTPTPTPAPSPPLVIGLTPKKKKRPVFNVTEQTTPRVQATITAEDGRTPLPGSVLSTLTLTLYADDGDETIINSRNQQNVLQTNGVTVDEFGTLLWVLQSADLAILDSLLPYERHIALIEWTWPTDKAGKAECVFVVRRVVS